MRRVDKPMDTLALLKEGFCFQEDKISPSLVLFAKKALAFNLELVSEID